MLILGKDRFSRFHRAAHTYSMCNHTLNNACGCMRQVSEGTILRKSGHDAIQIGKTAVVESV